MEPDQVRREMELALGGTRRTFRFSHRMADGSVREVEVYTGPVAFSGRTLLYSIIHDVTDRVRAEEARDRAEQILRHDLRSPLTGIAGLAGHLIEKEQDSVNVDALVAIREAAQRLLGLVGRNLDFCRIEQGSYVLSPRPVPLGELLQELIKESAMLARTRQVDLSLGGMIPTEMWEQINTFYHLVREAAHNGTSVLNNPYQFCDEIKRRDLTISGIAGDAMQFMLDVMPPD